MSASDVATDRATGVSVTGSGSAVPVLWGYRDFWEALPWSTRIRVGVRSQLDRIKFRRRRPLISRIEVTEVGRSRRVPTGELPLLVVSDPGQYARRGSDASVHPTLPRRSGRWT